jgi:hypothetical protein
VNKKRTKIGQCYKIIVFYRTKTYNAPVHQRKEQAMTERGQMHYAYALAQLRRGNLGRAEKACYEANRDLEIASENGTRSLGLPSIDPLTSEMPIVTIIDGRRLAARIDSVRGGDRQAADSVFLLRLQILGAGEAVQNMTSDSKLRWADLTLDWVDYETATDHPGSDVSAALERAREIYDSAGDTCGIAWSKFIEGRIHWRRHRSDETYRCFAEARSVILDPKSGIDPFMTLEFLVEYTFCLGRNGHHADARQFGLLGLELARQYGNEYQVNMIKQTIRLSSDRIRRRFITPSIYALKTYRLLASFNLSGGFRTIRSYYRNQRIG